MIDGRITVLVRGSGDVASAVAHALHSAGYAVALHEDGPPTTSRRGMAFADAVFDGTASLAGLTAEHVEDPARIPTVLSVADRLPLTLAPVADVLRRVEPDVLVDARMRKRAAPESQRGWVPLTIGLGPNFVAGDRVDVAIETAWGDDLGAVLARGAPRPLAGEPRPILGHARDRFVYAPAGGVFRTTRRIGERVQAGEVIATIGALTLVAPLSGGLRGLTRDGVAVAAGTKVGEIDPRGPDAVSTGIGERPGRIAEGVVEALHWWQLGGVVRWVGAQRDVLTGDLRPRVRLHSLMGLSHLYALGPLAGLRGEISILDGVPAVACVRDGADVTEPRVDVDAAFLVYAQIAAWDERPIPDAVHGAAELDAVLSRAARTRGIDLARPVAFLIRSEGASARFHVLDRRGDAPHGPCEHERVKVRFRVSETPIEVLGFRSDRHAGVFIPAGETVHMHLRTLDGRRSGHLEDVDLPPGSRLALPRRWPGP